MNFLQENWFYIGVIIALVMFLIKIGKWVGSTEKSIDSLQKGVEEVKKDLKSGLSSVQEDIKKYLKNCLRKKLPMHPAL